MTVRFPLVLVDGYPYEIARTDRVANSGNIARGSNQPGGAGTAVDGDLWYDTGNAVLKIWDGSSWASVSGSGSSSSVVISGTAPSLPTNGDLWYDSTNGHLKIYLASSLQWVPVQNNVFTQNSAPTSGVFEGDIWYAPSTGLFYIYIAGSTNQWVAIYIPSPIAETSQVIATDYTISSGKNGHSVGPVEISNNITVTIPNNAVWLVS